MKRAAVFGLLILLTACSAPASPTPTTAPDAGSVMGRLVARRGSTPLRETKVRLYRQENCGGDAAAETTVNVDNLYQLSGVAPGTYYLCYKLNLPDQNRWLPSTVVGDKGRVEVGKSQEVKLGDIFLEVPQTQ